MEGTSMPTPLARENDTHCTLARALDLRQIFAFTPKTPLKSFVSAKRREYPLPLSPFAHFSGQPIFCNSHQISEISQIFNFLHLFAHCATGPCPSLQIRDFRFSLTLYSCTRAAGKSLPTHHFRRAPFQVERYIFPCIPVPRPEAAPQNVNLHAKRLPHRRCRRPD